MKRYFDLGNSCYSQQIGFSQPLDDMSVGRALIAIEHVFFKDSVIQELDSGGHTISAFRFGVKLQGDYRGVYVASNWNADSEDFVYTKTGTGTSSIYQVLVACNTDKINNLLGFDPDGFKEVTLVECLADESSNLAGKYFDLYDDAGHAVRVWFKVGGAGAAPAIPSGGRLLEVDFAANTAAADIATAIASAVDGDAQFTAESDGSIATVTAATIGGRTAAVDGDTEFGISRWIAGSTPYTLPQKASVDLVAELYMVVDAVEIISNDLKFTVNNRVNNGNEGHAPDPNPAWPLPGELALKAMFTDAGIFSPSAAGNDDLTPALSLTGAITPGAGVGAFTRTFALKHDDAQPGTIVDLYIELPASANPTIEIRDDTSSGTLLHTVTGDPGGARYQNVRLVYRGGHFVKHFSGDIV